MTFRKLVVLCLAFLLACIVALGRHHCKPTYPPVPLLPTTLTTLASAYGAPTMQRLLTVQDLAEFRPDEVAHVQVARDSSWIRSEWQRTCFGMTNERMVVVTKAGDDKVVAIFTTRSYW